MRDSILAALLSPTPTAAVVVLRPLKGSRPTGTDMREREPPGSGTSDEAAEQPAIVLSAGRSEGSPRCGRSRSLRRFDGPAHRRDAARLSVSPLF